MQSDLMDSKTFEFLAFADACWVLHGIYVDLCSPEISETLGLDIQVLVSSGLCLENCSYTSLGLGLDHQEFPSLNLGLEINQQLSSANGTEFQKLLHN